MPAKTIAKVIYGDSEHCSDILYATGFMVPDPILWCSIGGDPFIIVSPLEYSRAKKQVKSGIRVWSYAEAKKEFQLKNLTGENQLLGISKKCQITEWMVPAYFPYFLAEMLHRNHISLRLTKGAFFPERESKNTSEIAYIVEAIRVAEKGLQVACDILRDASIVGNYLSFNGTILTAEILRGNIHATISQCGGVATHTIVACGQQGADPHHQGTGPLLANTPIILDVFPRISHSGYYGDLTRTVVKGKASPIVQRAFQAVKLANKSAINAVHSGIDGKNLHQVAKKCLQKKGFHTDTKASSPYGFIHSTGHGLGLDIHEEPRIGTKKSVLRISQVITIEPGLYYPEWGGMRIEDVVVVEKNGCRVLTEAPVVLEIP